MAINKINDGGRSYGSSTLNIWKYNGTTYALAGSGAGTYLSDDFSWSQASSSKEFTDSNDIPNGQVITRGPMSGKATLQYAASNTAQVEFGDVFRWADPSDGTPTHGEGTMFYFVIDSTERAERKGDEAKQSVTFKRVLNPITFKVTPIGTFPGSGSESAAIDLTTVITS